MIAGTVSGLCSAVYAWAYSFLIIEHLLLFWKHRVASIVCHASVLYYRSLLTVPLLCTLANVFDRGYKFRRFWAWNKNRGAIEKIGLQPEESASGLFLCTVPHKAHPMHLEVCCWRSMRAARRVAEKGIPLLDCSRCPHFLLLWLLLLLWDGYGKSIIEVR